MTRDGIIAFYLIQHLSSEGRWTESACEHFLFDALPYDVAHGDVGDRYRALLKPASASSTLWQTYGVHGFTKKTDAIALIQAIRERHPNRAFRITHRVMARHTEAMPS